MSENLQILLLSAHILLGICLVSIILIQKSKGSDMGAAFGGGASDTVFGARGAATFLSRTTAILATLFFASSLMLAYLHRAGGAATTGDSVFDQADSVPAEVVAPAVDPLLAPELDGIDIEGLDVAPAEPADATEEDSNPATPETATDTTDEEEPQGE